MRSRPIASPGLARANARKRKKEIAERFRYLMHFARPCSESHLAFFQQNVRRARLLVWAFAILFVTLCARGYYLATDSSIRAKADLVLLNSELSSVVALARESERLGRLASRLEDLSLSELRNVLSDASILAERASRDFQAQYASWSNLRGRIREDSSTYEALRAQLAELQRLQNEEIVRLKQMLDAAQEPSIYADVVNLLLSFSLGILSSLLASGLYTWWKSRGSSTA